VQANHGSLFNGDGTTKNSMVTLALAGSLVSASPPWQHRQLTPPTPRKNATASPSRVRTLAPQESTTAQVSRPSATDEASFKLVPAGSCVSVKTPKGHVSVMSA
jgi:hypothetical protein